MKESLERRIEPSLQWPVAELLGRYPETSAVFTRFRMACAGCVMAPFETLAEAADAYQIQPEQFLSDIHQVCGACAADSATKQKRKQ